MNVEENLTDSVINFLGEIFNYGFSSIHKAYGQFNY